MKFRKIVTCFAGLLLQFFLLLPGILQAQIQPEIIKGNITDTNGEPLIGVSVVIKGTNIGSITNADGNFTVESPKKQVDLVFSYIGFITKEIKANSSEE